MGEENMVNDLEQFEKADLRETNNGKIINYWNDWLSTSKKVIVNSSEVSLKWSIDRITIVGNLKKFHWVRDNLAVTELDFEQLWAVFEGKGIAVKGNSELP